MFTGLIEEVGRIQQIQPIEGGIRLDIQAQKLMPELRPGDSIAVNGVCLTVVHRSKEHFSVEAVGETLEKTTLGWLKTGKPVNLELALRVGDRLGGHFVQGHVNGVASVQQWQKRGENYWLEVALPSTLLPYVILEGSIALDGISLTVARLKDPQIGINIIPYTAQHTNLREIQPGDLMNVEVDLIAKYVERLLHFRQSKENTNLSNG